MATLRKFILNQSSLPTGNLVRDHIKNPSAGGSGVGVILLDGLEVSMEDCCFDVEVDSSTVSVEVDDGYIIEIESTEYKVEVC